MPVSSPPAARAALAPKRLTVLGSTGSIGCSTLDLVARNATAFEIDTLTANENVAKLAAQAREHGARHAVIADESRYGELKEALVGSGIAAAAGPAALEEAAARPVDMVVAAIVGAAGLRPTLAAVRRGTAVALANKECLVTAGAVFMRAVRGAGATLLPVDSEHSAVFQVLEPDRRHVLERVILTASGGPFRSCSRAEMASATPERALQHPNWEMGRKLTIDSATMMNKGLELIEAHHLFDVGADQLDVLVHPQSVVHSMVEYADGSVLAQLGTPDMRTPIAYALAWPDRMAAPTPRLDLGAIGQLTFEPVDHERFPAVAMALGCLRSGEGAPTVLNAANEIAVAAFLDRRIGFLQIAEVVQRTLDQAARDNVLTLADDLDTVFSLDQFARRAAAELVRQLLKPAQ